MNEQLIDNEVEKVRHIPHGSFPDVAGILLRRKAYLVLGTVMGVILGVLFYAMAPRKYESAAQVWVIKKQADNPLATGVMGTNSNAAAMTQDFLETHRAVLRSQLVVGRAIEKANLHSLEMFHGDERPMDTIIQSLKVEREIDKKSAARFNSQVLNVSFRGKVAEECPLVVHAILDSYQEFLGKSASGPMEEALKLITNARKLIQDDMEKKQKEYEEFRANTPVLWKGAMGTTLYQDRLANIDAKRSALMREQAELEATLAAADTAVKAGKGSAAVLHIISALPRDRGMPIGFATLGSRLGLQQGGGTGAAVPLANPHLTFEDELWRLQMEERKHSGVLGPEHPEMVSIRDRIANIQAMLAPDNVDASKPGALSENDRATMQRLADTKLAQIRQELGENKRSQQALTALFDKELVEAKRVHPYETQDDNFKRSLDYSYLLYENVLKRIGDLDLMSNVGGYDAQVITPPLPGEKVFPKGILVFPVALFMGFLTGFGLGYLAELTDKSFHTSEEIRSRLGLPIIGHIPVLKEDKALLQKIEIEGTPLHPRLCTHYRPRSRDAEAYRGVRTALYFSTRGRGYKTIQVTSPNMGDGKSTLAANLAVSIAQSGKKVILIDADFRRPQQDSLFGLPNKVGFASVLAGTATLEEALQETAAPGLSIIPSGPIPANPAELLTSQRFKEMLDVLGEQCDLVLVDTPPLLAVSDPSVIAPRVDGVVLALRLGKKSRPHAEQAKEVLNSLGAQVLGVVVNAVKVGEKSSYGYGGYGYGGYGNGENNRYYHEEHSESSNGTV